MLKGIWNFLTSGANCYKTLLFNFRMLPFKEAKLLPIWLYGKVDISRSAGNIRWINPTRVHTGGWKIGEAVCTLNGTKLHNDVTIVAIQGVLKLGEHGHISNGCRVFIKKGAEVELGDNLFLNEQTRLCSFIGIQIGNKTRTSWDCQIMDTDFHYIIQQDGIVYSNRKRVKIGNNVWIGNHVKISKGAGVGDGCIIASNSLLNHDYSEIKNGLFAGSPATLIKEGVSRVFDWELERRIDDFFILHPEAKKCNITDIINDENGPDDCANTPPRR